MLIRLDGGASNGKLGNKGESLLQMKAEGFNVPSGFVLDSGAYDDFICFNKLEDTVSNAVRDLTKDNVRETSEKIISAFDGAVLPDPVIKDIRNNISDGKLYAVRSSGSKEDLEYALFSTNGRMLIINSSLIPLKTTKSTQGVSVMTLRKGQTLKEVKSAEGLVQKEAKYRYRSRKIPAAGAIFREEDSMDGISRE